MDLFRFGCFCFLEIHRFGSVRFGKLHFPVRRGSACVFRTRSGSVRFGSVRFRVRFRPVPELNCSVRLGRFGSVSYSFLNDSPTALQRVSRNQDSPHNSSSDYRHYCAGPRCQMLHLLPLDYVIRRVMTCFTIT